MGAGLRGPLQQLTGRFKKGFSKLGPLEWASNAHACFGDYPDFRLAFEDPAGTARKIPNRKMFPTQFTVASDASETTVAAYGLSGRLKDFQFTQALLPHVFYS
jgi:hypothetical protein